MCGRLRKPWATAAEAGVALVEGSCETSQAPYVLAGGSGMVPWSLYVGDRRKSAIASGAVSWTSAGSESQYVAWLGVALAATPSGPNTEA